MKCIRTSAIAARLVQLLISFLRDVLICSKHIPQKFVVLSGGV